MNDVVFTATLPNNGDVNIPPDTDIVFTMNAPSGLIMSSLVITVGDDIAYSNGAFNRPGYSGTVVSIAEGNYATARVTPRRPFLYGVSAFASVQISSAAYSGAEKDITFYVQDAAGTLVNSTIKTTAVDSTYLNQPATDVFRRILQSTITGIASPSFLLSLCYRLQNCSLRCLGRLLPFAKEGFNEVPNARASDVGSTDPASLALIQVQPLWAAVLSELEIVGVDAGTLVLISNAQQSPYPSEIVGAAVASVLLTAQGILGFPLPGPLPP